MAENWSLYVAFSELLQNEFQILRDTILPSDGDYRRFRKTVVNLVLATDIASPERTQIRKSKWKEAFGDPFETVERKLRDHHRRQSIGVSRRGSLVSTVSALSVSLEDEESISGTPEHSDDDDLGINRIKECLPAAEARKLERRISLTSANTATSKYRQRLGILRTVDLSGETLETFSKRGGSGSSFHQSFASMSLTTDGPSPEDDGRNELKATVVMETIISAADVAQNLQGWEHMVKWSGKLFVELRRAYAANRGPNPEENWFENQIGFLESYLLPLTRRLEDTNVFGEAQGRDFQDIVEANRNRWLTHGFDETQKIIDEGVRRYPMRR